MRTADPSQYNLVFEPRQPIEAEGRVLLYKGRTRDGRGTLIFEDRHGLPLTMDTREFLKGQAERKIRLLTGAEAAMDTFEHPGGRPRVGFDSSDSEQDAESIKIAHRRMKYIFAWEQAGCPARTPENLRPIVLAVAEETRDPHPPSSRQVLRWIAIWQKFDRDPAMLVSQKPNSGNYLDKLPAKAFQLLEEVVNEKYLTDQRLTVVAVHRHVVDEFSRHNANLPENERLQPPSLNAVYDQVKKIDSFTLDFCRFGKRVAEHRHRLLKSGPVTEAHHERWEIDHTTVDCLTIDEKSGTVIGRPTVTVAIDRHTRMVMGFYISFDGPCTSAVMECLRVAILPKETLLAQHPTITGTWPCFGKPLTIVPDKGAEFRSAAFVEACLRLGIDVQYTPVLKPWYKGTIERFMKTLAVDVFHRVPGTTFSNFYQRNQEQTPEKSAVVTLAELKFYVLQYIVEIYHVRRHRGLDKLPIKAWMESVAAYGLLPPPDPDKLATDLADFDYRTVQREGIAYENFNYRSEALANFRTRAKRPSTVKIKIDPLDMTRIWFIDPFDNQPKEAFIDSSQRKLVTGITREKHRLARAMQRNNPEEFSGEEGLVRAFVTLDNAMAENTGVSGKENRRKAAAYRDKLMHAAKTEEPPAFDAGRSTTSITDFAFGTTLSDLDLQNVTMPEDSTFEGPGAREVKDRSSAGPEIAPNPIVDARTALNSSTTDDDFDPAEYARLHGLDVHKD